MSLQRALVVWLTLVLMSACSKETPSSGPAVPWVPPGSPAAGPPAAGPPPTAPGGPLAGATADPSFAGSYQGDIQGTPATLTARVQAAQLSGGINAGGYAYNFSGTITGTRASGTVTDPQTGGTMQFVATVHGSNLQFSISDANGGQLELSFQRAGSGAVPAASAPPASGAGVAATPTPAAPAGGGTAAAKVERDPRIVGSWRYREQLGDPRTGTMLIKWFLHIRPDGTFTYGNKNSQHDGQWQTKEGVVYVNDGSGWEAYARYTLGPQGMMFTFGDGSRRLFKPG